MNANNITISSTIRVNIGYTCVYISEATHYKKVRPGGRRTKIWYCTGCRRPIQLCETYFKINTKDFCISCFSSLAMTIYTNMSKVVALICTRIEKDVVPLLAGTLEYREPVIFPEDMMGY